MNDIQRFFAWFEGFVENIPGEPTREQWDKVVNRINALKDVDLAAAAMTPASAATPKPQQPMIKPTNATQWKAQCPCRPSTSTAPGATIVMSFPVRAFL